MPTTFHRLDGFELLGLPVGAGDPVALAADRSAEWMPVNVPGGVHEALVAAGRLTHPYAGTHEGAAAWVQEREWWYRCRVVAPRGPARLVLHGLDTVADVWLGGTHLGHVENQFRPAEFEVTTGGDDILLVRFTPPLLGRDVPPSAATSLARLAALRAELGLGSPGAEAEERRQSLARATTVRKASFSWGWDFAPALPSIGIWRPVDLVVTTGPRITGWHVRLSALSADRRSGTVDVRVEVDGDAGRVRVALRAPSGRLHRLEVALAEGVGAGRLELVDPELWWTRDLGEPAQHEVTVELLENGEVVDVATDRIGLRTLELDRGPGTFRFVLNGVPVFARGACWVPLDTSPGTVSPTTTRDRVRRAREGGLTMLRVWGGGVYESDEFYRACDDEGVLVWQDFMFACIGYPSDDPGLRREVELEAEYQVRRLRNRASLALWAGNNEVHVFQVIAHGDTAPGDWGWAFFHDLLPDAVARHAPGTVYWPGSPWGEPGPAAINGAADGDRHSWEVWHGLAVAGVLEGGAGFATRGDAMHYRRYEEDAAAFVSEFGILSDPALTTLARWTPDAEPGNAAFRSRLKDHPADKVDELLAVTTGAPRTLAEHVRFTQAVQAEGLAFGLAHYRRRRAGGALVWQYADCWPGASWSMIDYDGVPKAAYYAVARAAAPVAVSLRRAGGGEVEVWLVNDSAVGVEPAIEVELGTFAAGMPTRTTFHGRAAAGEAVLAGRLADVPADAAHYVWASSPSGEFPATRLHFAEIGELELPDPALDVRVEPGVLRIRARAYAYAVQIEHDVPTARLEDNHFDLRAGEERVIAVSGIDPASLRVSAWPSGVEALR